jgi:hypothetical protein
MVVGFLKLSPEEYMVLNLHKTQTNWASQQSQFFPEKVLIFGECEKDLSLQAKFPLMDICMLDGLAWLKTWPIVQVEQDKAMKKQLSIVLSDLFNKES